MGQRKNCSSGHSSYGVEIHGFSRPGTCIALRLRKLHGDANLAAEIAVDGGIDVETVPLAIAAGARALVVRSAVFKHPGGVAQAMAALAENIRSAVPGCWDCERLIGPMAGGNHASFTLCVGGFTFGSRRLCSLDEGLLLVRKPRLWSWLDVQGVGGHL